MYSETSVRNLKVYVYVNAIVSKTHDRDISLHTVTQKALQNQVMFTLGLKFGSDLTIFQ